MPIYLQLDGIEGDATQQAHQGWTDIKSLAWNIERSMNTLVGSSQNREGKQPSVEHVTLTKISDRSTPKLITEAATGQAGKTAKIHLVTTGSPGTTYLEFTLSNVLISSYAVTSAGDRPTEMITLDFTKIETKYTPNDTSNAGQSPIISSFDLATAQAS
jgi:type VI secretion system secreted protein Hcp